jgi:hypothetical protein
MTNQAKHAQPVKVKATPPTSSSVANYGSYSKPISWPLLAGSMG